MILPLPSRRDHIVHVKGPLHMPVSRRLRQSVDALLRRGQRRIVVDLSGVTGIDAAGVGELVRAVRMTAAVNGAVRMVNATAWVREMLERARVFELLSGERAIEQRLA